jgi:hypothetical protein
LEKSKIPPQLADSVLELGGVDGAEIDGHGKKKRGEV